jgi:general secretion pathway protein G
MRIEKGFTLVEILIVVVILGILAAIVIPQFTGASTEAKESSLMSDLQAVRGQIELYKIQHNDNLPGTDSSGDFITAMTTATDQDGVAGGQFGPYMQKIPPNPFSTADTTTNLVRTDGAAAGADTDNWWFSSTTGEFRADDNGTNSVTGEAHSVY